MKLGQISLAALLTVLPACAATLTYVDKDCLGNALPSLIQPFTASVNGAPNGALTNQLNAINQGGPIVQFFTIGIDPANVIPSHILTLSIDGDGGNRWAIDFRTVDITSSAAASPEPGSTGLAVVGLVLVFLFWRKLIAR